jgi:hypothetical protein
MTERRRGTLHSLPFTTFGEIAALSLEAAIYCSRCYEMRRIDPASEILRDRCFATATFRCTKVRYTGEACGSAGSVEIRPAELLPVGGTDNLAFLSCKTCLWQINHVPIDKPPWSVVRRNSGDRFRCPGCRRSVDWHIHGPIWRPSDAKAS